MNIGLGLGIEKRRGKGRVQGVYGAMANLMIASSGDKFTFGNSFSSDNTSPYSTIYPWYHESPGVYHYESVNSRVTKLNDGLKFGIGANAFIGVEYFFAPKMSIGGEFAWGLAVELTGKSKETVESWDYSASAVKTKETKSGGGMYIGIDTNNSGGAINLSFYF